MRYQDYAATSTKTAMEEAFKYAKKVPADKLEWKPLENGQSVIDMCRELAQCSDWAHMLVSGLPMPEFTPEAAAAMKAETSQWTTVEQCEEIATEKMAKLFELFDTVSDERLKETRWLPFSGGRDFTIMEIMEYPRWNATYHLGQVGYIQTLYGDREMY